MKKQPRIFLLIIMLFSLTACTSKTNERPEDFSLSLYWNTGALPPQYHYSYSINIQPTGEGAFEYQAGYEVNEEHHWLADFSLDESQLDTLYQYLFDNGLLRSDWQTGHPLMGGQGTSIEINANGEKFSIPSVSDLEKTELKIVQAAIETINEIIPQEIWDEMNARQDAYEKGYKD